MGQGVIGLLATRLAVLNSAAVLAVDRMERRRAAALHFGAAHTTLDPTSGRDVAAQVRALTGAGADAAIPSRAYPALHEAIRSVQPGGRVVAAGFTRARVAILDLGEEFHHNRVSVVASQIGGLPTALTHRWDLARLHRAALGLVAAGRVDVTSLVSHVVPVSDAASAYPCSTRTRQVRCRSYWTSAAPLPTFRSVDVVVSGGRATPARPPPSMTGRVLPSGSPVNGS